MSKKSKGGGSKLVQRSADEIRKSSPEDVSRLLAVMEQSIDTSDIPERKGPLKLVQRDAQGRLAQPLPALRDSPIRLAIIEELGRREMTRYQLWKTAHADCPTLPQSAVYEYIRGDRDIGLTYAEAMLKAVGLVVGPAKIVRPAKSASKSIAKPKAR